VEQPTFTGGEQMSAKMRLDMEALRVNSFDTDAVRGCEVRGAALGQATRGGRPTCLDTCTNTQPILSCYDPCG
jgi:hypothetical protein